MGTNPFRGLLPNIDHPLGGDEDVQYQATTRAYDDSSDEYLWHEYRRLFGIKMSYEDAQLRFLFDFGQPNIMAPRIMQQGQDLKLLNTENGVVKVTLRMREVGMPGAPTHE